MKIPWPVLSVLVPVFCLPVSRLPAQDCRPGDPLPPVELTFVSREAKASLIGFSEFTHPSAPPKRYRRREITGTMYWGLRPDGDCNPPDVPFTWEKSRSDDAPSGYPYGTITWSASLTPVSTTETGTILYRAATRIQGPEPMTLRIVVGLGNSANVTFADGEEKYLDPFSHSPPFNAVAVCPQLAGWGAALTDSSGLFVPAYSVQYRDEWKSVREYDGADPAGRVLLADEEASGRFVSRVFAFPTPGVGEPAGPPSTATYGALVTEQLTRLRRELSGADQCVPGPAGAVRVKGDYREVLSVEDTEEAAESRAFRTLGTSRTAYRTSRGQGVSWSSCLVTYTARFNITCPGDYLVRVRYSIKTHDATGPGEPRMLVVRRKFEVGLQTVTGEVEPKQRDLDYTIESVEAQLPCGDETAGAGSFDLGSVRAKFSLGRDAAGLSYGALLLEADAISPWLSTPAALLAGMPDSTGVEIIRDAAGNVRQVRTAQALADVLAVDLSSCELRFYASHQVGAQDTTSTLYAVGGTPFVAYRWEVVVPPAGGVSILRITETRASVVRTAEYEHDAAAGTWALTTGDGLRRESQVVALVNGERVKTSTVRDQDNRMVSRIARAYRTFPWGEELVRETVDPDGAALTTLHEYYESVARADPNYGRLRQRTGADGHWERFTYDANGRVLKSIRPFLNAAPTTMDENLCRVTIQTFEPMVDADGDGQPEDRHTTIERVLGQEVGRRYEIKWSRRVGLGADLCIRSSAITATQPGATWDTAGNLVTETLRLASGALAHRVCRVGQPDGTATVTRYLAGASGTLTTTVEVGRRGTEPTAILDGRRMVTVADETGQITSEEVTDIASGLVLHAWRATQFDFLGRPTRLEFDDGTFVGRSYTCCGLASERDRSGVTTTFSHDALGRVITATRLGVGTRTRYDAAGRVTSVTRIGSDGTEMPRETTAYDLAGRIVESRDALGRSTRFGESYDVSSGETTRVTTNPDGGTVIEVTARDGSLLRVRGTAVAPHTFAYGIDAAGPFVQDIAVGIDADGQPTASQWVKHYTDFAGRPLQSLSADGAAIRSSYNDAGQLVRQVDPDGVATLFAYNARGEQNVRAVDFNGNGAIDFAGSDRIVRTTNTVATRAAGAGPQVVQRVVTEAWEKDGADSPIVVSISEQTTNGLRSWQTVRGLTVGSSSVLDGLGGRTVTTTNPDGTRTIQIFDGDRLVATTVRTATDTQLSAVTYVYDSHGRLSSATDARTGITTYTYHSDDRIRSMTTPDPDPTRAGPGYDAQTTTYAYDAAGRVAKVTPPDGREVTTTYWPTGATRRIAGARTYPVEYTYDPQGRLLTLTTWQDLAADSGRATTRWFYDPVRGFLTGKRYADGTGPSYTYNPSGRLLTRTWARSPGSVASYAYDAAGDWVATDYSDATPDWRLTLDRARRPRTISDGSGTRALAYTAAGQLETEAYTSGPLSGRVIQRTFDGLHRPSGLSVPSVLAIAYGYDAASRLITVSAGTNATTYDYLANSSLVETVTFRTGGTERLATRRTYDHLNRLSAISSQPSSASSQSHVYAYDAANQRTQVAREDGSSWRHTYDGLGQVTSGVRSLADDTAVPGYAYAWTFDDIGNRRTATTNAQSSTYASNPLNQVTQRTVPGVVEVTGAARADATITVAVNGGLPQPVSRQGERFYQPVPLDNVAAARYAQIAISGVKNLAGPLGEDLVAEVVRTTLLPQSPERFAYDADGNLLADGRWRYGWDAENRLVSVETAPEAVLAGAPRRRMEFGYDGPGRRVVKRVSTWRDGSWVLASHIQFLYDGWQMIAELNLLSGGAAVRTYVWGVDVSGGVGAAGGVGGLLWVNDGTGGGSHGVACDGNGNVGGLVRADDGTWSGRYDYTAFGETVHQEGSYALANPFRFSTKYTDEETGWVYYGYRYYAPSTGRWLNRDPITEEGGVNLYGFVGNTPTATVDPFGLALYAFDGTNNDGYRDRPKGEETNVYILASIYKGNAWYIAGVGTNDGPLNLLGLAFGAGGVARVNQMLGKASEYVQQGDLVADILGFSRGAAQARAFANKLKESFPCVTIRWIGLFDTVASTGLPNNVNIGYNLGIPQGTGSVLHLTAGAERRRTTFALSSIRPGPDRSNSNPNYREEEMPDAVHSDVGGAYGENRGLANQALIRMWWDGLNHDVPFGPVPARYTNVTPNGPNDSRWFSDKFVEIFTGVRHRKVFFHP